MKLNTFADCMGASVVDLLKFYRSEFCISQGKGILRSKVLVAIERKKESTKSLTAFMTAEFGVVDSNAFKPARVFRDMVTLNTDHTASDTPGHGGITEAQFDAIKSPRTFIEASAILGLIEKHYAEKPEEAAAWREELAVTLRPAMDEGERRKLLAVLKTKLKPADKDGDKEGSGNPDSEDEKGTKSEGEKDGEKSVPLAPLAVLAMLHGNGNPAAFAFWSGLSQYAKLNPDKAQSVLDDLDAVSRNIEKFRAVIRTFVPAEAPASETPAIDTTATTTLAALP